MEVELRPHYLTFQINTLQDVLGDYEISIHLTNTAKYSRFLDFTRLISNLIHVVGCLCEESCFNVRNASEETHFVGKVTFMVLTVYIACVEIISTGSCSPAF